MSKLSDLGKMRGAKYLRIKSLQKSQEHPQGIASIFGNLFNSKSWYLSLS